MPPRRKAIDNGRRATLPNFGSVEFHVIPNGDRWDVERDDTFTGAFAYDVTVAIGVAISSAQRDRNNGLTVSVCVQQPDGSCRHVWP
jgi:hypothetical protein